MTPAELSDRSRQSLPVEHGIDYLAVVSATDYFAAWTEDEGVNTMPGDCGKWHVWSTVPERFSISFIADDFEPGAFSAHPALTLADAKLKVEIAEREYLAAKARPDTSDAAKLRRLLAAIKETAAANWDTVAAAIAFAEQP